MSAKKSIPRIERYSDVFVVCFNREDPVTIDRIARARRHATALSVSFALLLAAGPAPAQTCANPIPLVDGQTHAYDTCAATNSLPYLGG